MASSISRLARPLSDPYRKHRNDRNRIDERLYLGGENGQQSRSAIGPEQRRHVRLATRPGQQPKDLPGPGLVFFRRQDMPSIDQDRSHPDHQRKHAMQLKLFDTGRKADAPGQTLLFEDENQRPREAPPLVSEPPQAPQPTERPKQ